MAKVLKFLTVLLLHATVTVAQDTETTPPTAEFLREPIAFRDFRWVGDTLYLDSRDALYRFRPDDGDAPEQLRPFFSRRFFKYISPNADMVISEEYGTDTSYFIIYRESIEGELISQLNVESGEAVPVTAYSRDGRMAAVLLPDWQAQHIELRLYDLEASALLWESRINPNEGVLSLLTFSPDGKYLAVYGETNSLLLWDTGPGRVIERFTARDKYDIIRGVSFSPDSQFLYYAESARLVVMQLESTDRHARWVQAQVYPAATDFLHLLLSADGQRLIGIAYQEGELHVWRVEGASLTPERFISVENGSWLLRLPVISDDGRFLAAADFEGVIRVWRLQ